MSKRCDIFFPESKGSVSVLAGTNLLEILQREGLPISSVCGGKGKCGKCKIKVIGETSPPSEIEKKFLTPKEIREGIRLACQTKVLGNVVLYPFLKEEKHRAKILAGGIEKKITISPSIKKEFCEIPVPSLGDSLPDWERILRACGLSYGRGSISLLQRLPKILREINFQVTIVRSKDEILTVEAGDSSAHCYGVAFDIGTTTLVGYLVDLRTGENVAVVSRVNPQRSWGQDVITRIDFVSRSPDQLQTLQGVILNVINEMILDLAKQAQILHHQIYEAIFVGNPTMIHIFLGIPPDNIANSPFVPVFRSPITGYAQEIGVRINERGLVHCLPLVSGYIGADIIAGLLVLPSLSSPKSSPFLFMDIGTNGEMVLGLSGRLIACSTAAGPAFEGGHIHHGMSALTGAIEKVAFRDDVHLEVIGGKAPVGICGSGLIDAIAGLLDLGLITPDGRLLPPEEAPSHVPTKILERVERTDSGTRFLLYRNEDKEIFLTQKDIREVQLAKSAMKAGIQVLTKEAGIEMEEIKKVYLAGAFGNYIRKESAQRIGLLPIADLNKVVSLGNAAGIGAKMCVLSYRIREKARQIAEKIEYIELSGREDFGDLFIQAMAFE